MLAPLTARKGTDCSKSAYFDPVETHALQAIAALSPDAVMMEIKQGPYEPAADKDFLAGFPLEGSEAAAEQEAAWRALFGAGDDQPLP